MYKKKNLNGRRNTLYVKENNEDFLGVRVCVYVCVDVCAKDGSE